MAKSELPKGWEWKRVGDILDLSNGKSMTKKRMSPGASYAVYGSNGVIGRSDSFLIEQDTLVVGRVGSAGVVNKAKAPCWISDNAMYISGLDPIVDMDYLFHALSQLDLPSLAKLAAQPSVSQEPIKAMEIPVPPLEEQKRIVARIEELLSRIDQAKSLRQRAVRDMETMLDSALAKRLQTARNRSFERVPLGKVCEFQGGSQPPKSQFSSIPRQGYVRLVQIRDYKTDSFPTYVKKSSVRRFCQADDVMIGRYGPPLFQILRGIEGAYNVALMKAAPDESRLSKSYLYYLLKDPALLRKVVAGSARSAGQTGVQKELLQNHLVVFPPLKEQSEVVTYLEKIEKHIDEFQHLQSETEREIEQLTQSILTTAFRGEL